MQYRAEVIDQEYNMFKQVIPYVSNLKISNINVLSTHHHQIPMIINKRETGRELHMQYV